MARIAAIIVVICGRIRPHRTAERDAGEHTGARSANLRTHRLARRRAGRSAPARGRSLASATRVRGAGSRQRCSACSGWETHAGAHPTIPTVTVARPRIACMIGTRTIRSIPPKRRFFIASQVRKGRTTRLSPLTTFLAAGLLSEPVFAAVDINGGSSWGGWNHRGNSRDVGIWGARSTTRSYEIYTTVFTFGDDAITGGWTGGATPIGAIGSNLRISLYDAEANQADASQVTFGVAVPAPGAAGCLGLAGVLAWRAADECSGVAFPSARFHGPRADAPFTAPTSTGWPASCRAPSRGTPTCPPSRRSTSRSACRRRGLPRSRCG